MGKAIELAATAGIGFVGVRRTNHFGIASFYVQQALQQGFIGCAASNAPPHMAPFGGRARFLGTNPFSIGIPANKEAPLLFDASTSVVARGKIIVAAQEGKTIPPGWAIDPEGNPTTDAQAALAGSVLPFGGPKGSAISLIVDVLCGVLTGSAFALNLNTLENLEAEQNLGHIFMAMRTDLFMTKDEFAGRMDEMVRMLKSSPPAPDVERVLAPGEIERQNETKNRVLGVPLVSSVIDQLAALGDELNVGFPKATTGGAPAEARP
jgi:LDH2 family malate/lactate/ureidoglycolate dehydrogenase